MIIDNMFDLDEEDEVSSYQPWTKVTKKKKQLWVLMESPHLSTMATIYT
jgi:hypothetical protein